MTLARLRHDIDQLGHDDDQSEVVLLTTDEQGNRVIGLLCGVGYTPTMKAVMLMDEGQARRVTQEKRV